MDEKVRQALNCAKREDFDGHTEFANMTPDQRLSWLDEANAAFLELHGLVQQETKVAEESPDYKTPSE